MCQQHGDKVLIVDAGGGTIDISSYVVTKGVPLQVEELFRPECQSCPLRLLVPSL